MHEKTKKYESKRIVTTILKMDENNHYGNAMIKPLLVDVKKKQKTCPNLRKFEFLIESLSHEDKIGHLFIVDIKFKEEKENEKIFFSIKFPLQYLKKKNIWVLQAICFSTFGYNEKK